MTDEQWGPLAALAGTWRGDEGLDVAWSHAHGASWESPYTEELTLTPFGPVVNGSQHLCGLDHRSSMWRGGEQVPFHTEVGYWLWDGATGEVLKCFVVPRGISLVAGGTAGPGATAFELRAGEGTYRIAENRYLASEASTLSYLLEVEVRGPDEWAYSSTTMLRMRGLDEPYPHTDRNVLRRVG